MCILMAQSVAQYGRLKWSEQRIENMSQWSESCKLIGWGDVSGGIAAMN